MKIKEVFLIQFIFLCALPTIKLLKLAALVINTGNYEYDI